MNVYRITLTLEEPATIGTGAAVSNEMRTRQGIPATALRGALYDELRLAGLGGHASAWFGPQGPRWSDAWPERCVPMPRSFMKIKRDEGFTGLGVWNAFSTQPPPDQDRYVWQRISDPWLHIENGMPRGSSRAPTRIDMHVSLNYGSQSARESALFSRETLKANSYYAYVSSLQPLADRLSIKDIAIGKRHSVNGRATIHFSREPESPFGYTRVGDSTGAAYIQLMSPALIPGARGGWLRGLDLEALRDLGLTATGIYGFSSFTQVVGWNGLWKLPKEPCVAIAAGSCWRIAAGPAALNWWLDTIERDGLGIRTHEGFGWVAVNPPWLTKSLGQSITHSAPPGQSHAPKPRPWPGFNESDWPRLVELDQFASALAGRWEPDRSRAVYQGLSLIRQGRPVEPDAKPWSEIKEALTCEPGEVAHQAFLLSAVLFKLRAKEEKLSGERT